MWRLALMAGLVLIGDSRTGAQDNVSLLSYVANVSKLRTLECVELVYHPSEPDYADSPPDETVRLGSKWLVRRLFRKIDLEHDYVHIIHDVWSSKGSDVLGGRGRSVRSYVDREKRSYMDRHSPAFRNMSFEGAYGAISERRHDEPGFVGLHSLLGFHANEILSVEGESFQDLHKNILSRKVEVLDADTFLIRDYCGAGSSTSVQFRLAPEFDFMPKELSVIKEEGKLVSRFVVDEFAKIDGFWIPTKATCTTSTPQTVLSESVFVFPRERIRVNFASSADDFRLQFPPDQPYCNQLTGEYWFNGKVTSTYDVEKARKDLEASEAFERLRMTPKTSWFAFAARIFVVAIVLVGLVFGVRHWRVRRFEKWMILGGLFGALQGCSSDAGNRFVIGDIEVIGGNSVNIRNEHGNLIDSPTFEFRLKNVSDHSIRMEPRLRLSCGCTSASFNSTQIDVGSEAVLRGKIDAFKFPASKTVQIVAIQLEPSRQEIPLYVNVTFTGDWIVSEPEIFIDGTVFQSATGVIECRGTEEAIRKMELVPVGVSVKQQPSTLSTIAKWNVYAEIPADGMTTIGELHFRSVGSSPNEWKVPIHCRGRPAGSWSPAALLLAEGEKSVVVLNVEKDWEIEKVEGGEALGVTRLSGTEFLVKDHGPARVGDSRVFVTAVLSRAEGPQKSVVTLPVVFRKEVAR